MRTSSQSLAAAAFVLAARLVSSAAAGDEKGSGNSPPPFFLIDTSDQLCLAGEEFKRCSIDTLFYVVGAPGKYQIHKRAVGAEADDEDGLCISKKSCKDSDLGKMMEAKLAKCSHCGAKNWNILGDADSGYVLTEGEGKTCLAREPGTNKAVTVACDSTELSYTPLQLQFASAGDIKTMSSEGARLVGAASDGDMKAVQALLAEGIDVNVKDWDELTALIPAASSGNLEICKFLVEKGIDVNAKDKDGITALMEASIMGHNEIVEFLIESGAQVDAVASSGVNALWLAASEGRTEVMSTLLKKDADPSVARADGITALMTASVGGRSEAVKLLLDAGADPTVTDKDGLTPLINAAENGTVATLKYLVEHVGDAAYVNRFSNTGYSAVIIASAHGHADAIKYLVSAGSDVDAVSDTKVTALMYAAASGHIEAMKALIEDGKADLEAKHTNGGTALLEASTGGMSEAVKFLVDAGAVVDFTDDDDVTPLMAIAAQGKADAQAAVLEALKKNMDSEQLKAHINMFSMSGGSAVMFAAAGGHVEAAKQLMDLGADIQAIVKSKEGYLEKLEKMIKEGQVQEDEPHVDGVTALHVAAQGGHEEMVKVLVDAGADTSVLDDEKRSALTVAVQNNHAKTAKVLVEAGSDPNTVYVDSKGVSHNLLFDAIMVENIEFALLLIEKGADLYYTDAKKVSTLLQASHRGLTDVVAALLKKHAESGKEGYIDDSSEDGITPLIAAASEGRTECVKLLVEAKANVNASDKDGTSALMAASARGHDECVKALLDAGANINDQNSDGHTALMFAYNGKNQVETLWERYSQFASDAKDKGEDKSDDNGTGRIIREALDKHSATVDLLLKSGADTSLKDKEGHKALDFDFHSDADAEILAKEAAKEKVRDESKNEL